MRPTSLLGIPVDSHRGPSLAEIRATDGQGAESGRTMTMTMTTTTTTAAAAGRPRRAAEAFLLQGRGIHPFPKDGSMQGLGHRSTMNRTYSTSTRCRTVSWSAFLPRESEARRAPGVRVDHDAHTLEHPHSRKLGGKRRQASNRFTVGVDDARRFQDGLGPLFEKKPAPFRVERQPSGRHAEEVPPTSSSP
jgi:hypothetical protein